MTNARPMIRCSVCGEDADTCSCHSPREGRVASFGAGGGTTHHTTKPGDALQAGVTRGYACGGHIGSMTARLTKSEPARQDLKPQWKRGEFSELLKEVRAQAETTQREVTTQLGDLMQRTRDLGMKPVAVHVGDSRYAIPADYTHLEVRAAAHCGVTLICTNPPDGKTVTMEDLAVAYGATDAAAKAVALKLEDLGLSKQGQAYMLGTMAHDNKLADSLHHQFSECVVQHGIQGPHFERFLEEGEREHHAPTPRPFDSCTFEHGCIQAHICGRLNRCAWGGN